MKPRHSATASLLALTFTLTAGAALAVRGDAFGGGGSAGGEGILAYEGVTSERPSARGGTVRISACTASVIDLPGVGPRIVTARHCDGKEPQVFSEKAVVRPVDRREIAGGPDVAVLGTDKPLPKDARVFATRASSSLRMGEELCAFRTTQAFGRLTHERVCGAYLGTTMRFDGGRPRLVVGHPFEHGTSGSPLMDREGRVVGIVVSTTTGEGFAEPIEEAVRAARAPAFSTKQAPPPFDDKPRTGLRGLIPREGSFCLPGFCLRWEI